MGGVPEGKQDTAGLKTAEMPPVVAHSILDWRARGSYVDLTVHLKSLRRVRISYKHPNGP